MACFFFFRSSVSPIASVLEPRRVLAGHGGQTLRHSNHFSAISMSLHLRGKSADTAMAVHNARGSYHDKCSSQCSSSCSSRTTFQRTTCSSLNAFGSSLNSHTIAAQDIKWRKTFSSRSSAGVGLGLSTATAFGTQGQGKSSPPIGPITWSRATTLMAVSRNCARVS